MENIMKKWICAVILCLITSANAVKAQVTPPKPLKSQMSQFEGLIMKLSPYLLNEADYKDPKNQIAIESILTEMNKTLGTLQHDKSVQKTTMKFRFEVLAEGFKDVEESFKAKAVEYSYWNLKSQLHQCSSCHTEKQLGARIYDDEVYKKSDLFMQAEFQFMLRNYEAAVKKYVQIIEKYKSGKVTNENLDRALKKVGYYFVRIKKDDQETLKTIEALKSNKELPRYMLNHLQKWADYLKIKKYRLLPEKSENLSVKDMQKFVDDRESIAQHFGLGQDRFLVDQETLIYLHKVLESSSDQKLNQWLYLWLAKFHNNYKESLFDRTSELYLKECIAADAKTKIAKECEKELKEIKKENLN